MYKPVVVMVEVQVALVSEGNVIFKARFAAAGVTDPVHRICL